VLELEGQFDKLDSYFLGDDGPPEDSAGWWHLSCLRASDVGRAWQAARLRNYRDVRKFEIVAELPGWVVMRDPRGRESIAIGVSGELVELPMASKSFVREVDGGLVFRRVETTFHLELGDEAVVLAMQLTLEQTSVYPVSAVLAALGISDRVADAVALGGATLRFDKGLRSFWGRHGVSAQIEYGVFVPQVLEPFVREGKPSSPSMAAIVTDPDDEQARLAYARAVAATDPARAEFIEVQLQLAELRKAGLRPPGWEELGSREYMLRLKHAAHWATDLLPLVDACHFWRGFVEEVTLPAARFLASAPELYRRTPILHLNLKDVRAVASELFASPHLARIRSLRMSNNEFGDEEATLIAESTQLGNLEWLDIRSNKIGRAGLEALAASQRLPKLGYVDFAWNATDDPTPRHADEYDYDSDVAKELQARYGPRRWLSSAPRAQWPPSRDAA
jgi:uncharacterized protein (TIGR02996 family)